MLQLFQTPMKKWDNFGFRDYRSSTPNSDGSGTTTPVQTPVHISGSRSSQLLGYSGDNGQVPPKPDLTNENVKATIPATEVRPAQRREKRMRFSFLLGTDESPKVGDGAHGRERKKRSGRPSILAVAEHEEEEQVSTWPAALVSRPSNGSATITTSSNADGSTTSNSIHDDTISNVRAGSQMAPEASQKNSLNRPRMSSPLDASEYFDAMEQQDQTLVDKLGAIKEDEIQQALQSEDGSEPLRTNIKNPTAEPNIGRERVGKEQDPRIRQQEHYSDEDDEDDEENEEQVNDDEDDYSSSDLSTHTTSITPPRLSRRPLRTDTARLKRAYRSLLRYDESEAIYTALMTRLQRMLADEDRLAARERRKEVSVYRLARRLRMWLDSIAEGRVVMGEHAKFVGHEREWARWIEEAGRTGVLFVR
jgi:hypothetical protein